MASYPPFDPNDFGSYPAESRRNRAVADVYEPGSTFKIITAAAGLETGVVREDEMIDCQMGGINLWKGIRVRDHKPYGVISFAQVIAKSSNVGVIKVAQRIKDERFYRTLRDFGFGERTGIDLPGESGGILQRVERWGPIAKAYIAFGQGVSVTPIQLASAAAAVANGGTLLKPHVVDAVGQGEARVAKYPTPPVVSRPLSQQTALRLTRLMEEVVTEGTGKPAAVAGYRVAGKTGTAQIAVHGGYRGYLPSFLGFAPADRPALVGLVAVAEPQGGEYYGAQVAAPAFGAIIRQVLLYRGVHPERDHPSVWPGQVMMASLPGAHPAAPRLDADENGDGDEHDAAEAGAEPVLWQGASPAVAPSPSSGPPGGPPPGVPAGAKAPESDHSSDKGGRSHASL
jgi:cell division protein FtsI/penicillin-binding protein 2